MDAVANISLKGCALLYKEYRASLLKNKIIKWQSRIEDSLNEVLAVKEYLTDEEVKLVCEQVQFILAYIRDVHALASDQSTLFHAHKQTKNLDDQSRTVLTFARNVSSTAKMRMLEAEPKKVDKNGLLDKLWKKAPEASNAANSLGLLADVVNTHIDSFRVDMPTSVGELSKGLVVGEVRECEASRQFVAALKAADDTNSDAATSNDKLRLEFEIKAVVRVSRAMQIGAFCTCPHSCSGPGRQCLQILN